MTRGPFRLGIVTGDRAPELSEDGRRSAAALSDRGFAAEPVHWADESVEWSGYDGALVRSCWDYPTDLPRFRALLAEMEGAGVAVCNPLDVVRWNLHKSYVLDLADRGVRVPPTAVVDAGSDVSLGDLLARRGWEEAVVKPAIGTSSRDVFRVSAADAGTEADRFERLLGEGDVLVQRFVPEIVGGERSAVLFGGEFSHAWNSLTGEDVTEFEGIDADYEPTPGVVEAAVDAVRAARDAVGVGPERVPYARVDYVLRDGDLLLMELELIEPYLGLDRGEGTVEAFADALATFFRADGG